MRYIAVTFCIMAGMSAFAQSEAAWREDAGWFVGGVIGSGELDEKIVEDGDVLSDNSDDRDITAGLVAGYQFNRYVGIEVGYHIFGEMKVDDGEDHIDLDVQGIKVLGYGRWPIGKRFALVGKGGLFHSYVQETVRFGNRQQDDDEWDVSFSLEAGAHFKLTPRLTGVIEIGYYNLNLLDFDWDHDDDHDDDHEWWEDFHGLDRSITSAQVGLRYRF